MTNEHTPPYDADEGLKRLTDWMQEDVPASDAQVDKFRAAMQTMRDDPAEADRIDRIATDAEQAAKPWLTNPNFTGCLACGSDDYETEPGSSGEPDYANGNKQCNDCGNRWV